MPLVVEGHHRLEGQVRVGGAKNAALPIIAATLLTDDECLLENVPYIEDIRNMVKLLHHLGVAARFEGPNTLRVKATRISKAKVPLALAKKMRASFLTVGPLLSRFGQAEAPHPGGCAIGTRPVSVDLKGFQHMGAEIQKRGRDYAIKTPRLRGEKLILDYPSHTGTENLLMAACLADGVTYIENASVEPEVVDLANFLSAMGARIHGVGTNTIQVEGTRRLHGTIYHIMPDRMEAGTFALAALISGGDVSMGGAVARWLGAVTNKMRETGATVEIDRNVYRVRAPERIKATDIQTYPYPGFPTDLQAPFATVLTQAEGNSSIYETMYDGRLAYAKELAKMGAHIDVSGSGRIAIVHGPTALHGANVCALDIRSGAAMILASLAAEGVTEISDVIYIDRGYQDIAKKLEALGAVISRVEELAHTCPEAERSEPLEWGATSMAPS
ncbi:MAG: UDP-N-acetylglucosamine 1-carboxyvinyltransferase [Chloroflexota bacterium]|nr:UDP-N-acetylglucosamine 1-carboxyvinyltransferase [Chloroflexota bacterium]